MKEIEYVNEKDFKSEFISFDDLHYQFTEGIFKQLKLKYGNMCSPIMVKNDKKSLMFCINLNNDKIKKEKGNNTYKIIVEKIIN